MGIMGRIKLASLVSIVVALAMVVPALAFTQQADNTVSDAADGTEYVLVNYNGVEASDVLRDLGAGIVGLREMGAYVKVTPGQKEFLSRNFDVVSLPKRTMVELPEQGISFDSNVGYDLADQWRNPGTNTYMVQFVAPMESAWIDAVEAASGKAPLAFSDNLVVVKMTNSQKAAVENLDFVQWVGAYEPGFKVDRKIAASGLVKVSVEAFDAADISSIVDALESVGATQFDTVDTITGVAVCYVDASALPSIAKLEAVKFVWNYPDMEIRNNVGGRISQAHDLWVSAVSNLPSDITGAGQTIHIQDTGLDATHYDFTQGALGNRITYRESATDADYHGTHCTGIAAGNGYDMEGYLGLTNTNRIYDELATSNPAGRPDRMGFAGRAPEAYITSNAGFSTTEWTAAHTTYNAHVFSNSWGPSLVDNNWASGADSVMSSNPTMLIIFAAGNDGPGTNTVSGNGNGKLAVSVGATENMRAVDFDSSDDFNQMVSFSSRGPVADGRIKPDVVEIGTAVYSTLSDDSAAENAGYECYDTINIINYDTSDALGDYISLQGTSMACPAAAGDSILIRDYLVDVKGYDNVGANEPHANLIKTLLIHGAEDMGLGYPSMDQGWGRVNVRNSICPPYPNVLQWYHHTGLGSGTWSARVNGGMSTYVIDNTVPLKVTMVHWDTVASGELVTDLDLVVTSPSGVRYEGNAFKEAWSTPCTGASQWGGTYTQFPSWVGGNSYDYDEENDGGDDENNVEIFRVKYPEKGLWNVQVVWRHGAAQPFSIAMTGGFNASADVNAATNVYRVNMGLDVPRIVPERDDFGEGTFKCAPSGSVIVPYWINNGGTTNDQYAVSSPILPAGITISYYPSSPVSVAANTRSHGYARIMVGAGVTAGTYTVSIKAQSNNDATTPIAQASIKFQIDVVTTETPPTIKVASTSAHESAPYFVSWNEGTTYYIGCVYTQDTQFGERVMYKLSSDGGATWGSSVTISQPSWTPGYVAITRAPSGTYAGRLMIAYNAWNPIAYGGNSGDTRCSFIKVHYSTDRGATWSAAVDAFVEGEGVEAGGANTYRTIDINYVTSVNQFYLTVENFGYDGTDLNTAAQVSIACVGKSSTNGGATWGSYLRIDPGVAGMYYFFPNTEIDNLGNMVLFFYQRDSSDAAQDRDATYMYYNGAWGTMQLAWDTSDNLMMPQTTVATQGANSNRAYGAYLKGANTDGDRYLYLIYTDNPNAATPTWTTNLGPFANGVVMSDHDYGTRFVFDLVWQSPYMYIFGHRNIKYDPYGQPNMLAVYDQDYTTSADTQTWYLTLDSYVHGKQRAEKTTHNSVAKVFVAQNAMSFNLDRFDAGHDIIGMHVYPGWESATDSWGPVTEYLSASKTICNVGDLITLVANVHDWTTGASNVAGAQYSVNNNVTWTSMASFDGSFNSPAEAVTTSTAIDTSTWTPNSWKWVSVRGSDQPGNVGAIQAIKIWVNPQVQASATATGPVGYGTATAVTLTYEKSGLPTSIQLYYTKNTASPYTWTLAGTDATPNDGTYAYTITGGEGSYGWCAVAVGGSSTETAPTTTTAPEASYYILDTTAPNAPSGLTVERYGPSATFGTPVTAVRYLRGVPNEVTVNTLTCYSLGVAQSTTSGNWGPGNNVAIHLGARFYVRSSAGVETEFSSGLVATVSRTAAGSGFQTATWTPPQTYVPAGSSVVMKVYGDTTSPPTTLRATFTTEVIGEAQIDAVQWTVQYWTRYAGNPTGSDWYWGTTTYDNHITNFQYTPMVARDPQSDNTLNWTASGSADVSHYNIYRSAASSGPWDGTTLFTTVPFGTNTYLDTDHGNADGTLWWYVVRAQDLAGNLETNTNAIRELGVTAAYFQNITVVAGWNLVSVNLTGPTTMPAALTDLTGGVVWSRAIWYNPNTMSDPWKQYNTAWAAGLNDLTAVDRTMGVWVFVTTVGDGQICIGGASYTKPTTTTINMKAGWNLIGFPSDDAAYSVAQFKIDIGQPTAVVEQFDGGQTYLTSVMASGNFVPDRAYWVWVPVDTPWIKAY